MLSEPGAVPGCSTTSNNGPAGGIIASLIFTLLWSNGHDVRLSTGRRGFDSLRKRHLIQAGRVAATRLACSPAKRLHQHFDAMRGESSRRSRECRAIVNHFKPRRCSWLAYRFCNPEDRVRSPGVAPLQVSEVEKVDMSAFQAEEEGSTPSGYSTSMQSGLMAGWRPLKAYGAGSTPASASTCPPGPWLRQAPARVKQSVMADPSYVCSGISNASLQCRVV